MYLIGPPPPATDDPDAPRLILRDGSVADIAVAGPDDRDAVRRFFHDLSPASRRLRFHSTALPSDTTLDRLCDVADPRALTLLAWRRTGAGRHIIAVASYSGGTADSTDVSFAVDDQFHGRGLATSMLERLAVHARAAGFTRFDATTFADNAAMLDVFRESGFAIRSRASTGCLDIDLSLTPSVDWARASEHRSHIASVASLQPMLAPRAVAVIGASHTRSNIGRRILLSLTSTFAGQLYAVHPSAAEIDGVPAVRNARDLPAGVEMAVVAVPPDQILTVVDDCAAAGVKALVVVTAGFAETGTEGHVRQDELAAKTRSYGIRMLGTQLYGSAQSRSSRPDERLVLTRCATGRARRVFVAERRSRHRDSGPRVPARRGPVRLRQRRQQSRRVEQRPARVLGRRPEHTRGAALPRVVRQSAPFHRVSRVGSPARNPSSRSKPDVRQRARAPPAATRPR